MSRFLTPLDSRKLGSGPRGRSTYKLLSPLVYQSDMIGRTVMSSKQLSQVEYEFIIKKIKDGEQP